ncbi:GntR family transcriptional regulator [Rhodobium gokarnense]|uniref:DNA-binding GntR family transcriptional regulator n=1 Tax=Rhodobium gokarnense TaxID=364296 RepID=A0ABT3HF50_9HYPH|nr:FCD domain-containing protein [Rhodobium gokarnense]MCW2309026.1 DNA-binding GntR family transcriptional regulator [Rhodobium gokarnense]
MTGSRSETAWRILQSAIINGEFPPGAQLRFQELQEFCGMSVSPVREALTRLVAAGLVEVEHNRGYRVTKLVVSELDDLVRTRSRVEGWALEESIRLGDEHWEAALISSLHLLEHLPRRRENGANLHDERWEARHAEFHDNLVSACGSPILLEFCRTLYSRADRYRRFSLSMETGSRDVAAEHRAILDAALARDADKAKDLLAAHYEATASFIRDHLSEE